MNNFDPSIDYANPERTSCGDEQSLRESVALMCAMWNEIANELDAERIMSARPQIRQRTVQYKDALTEEQVKRIIDMNMACEAETTHQSEDVCDNDDDEPSEEEIADRKTCPYADMFEQ
jgi:hypothetical protein